MRGTNSRILYDYYDASMSTAEWEISSSVEELEVPRISSDVMTYAPGNSDFSLTINGYIEGIESGFEEVLNSALNNGDRHVALILDHTNIPATSYKKRISAEKGIRAAVKVFNSIDGNKEIFTFAVNK